MTKFFNSALKYVLLMAICCFATNSYARKTASIIMDYETGKVLSETNSEELMYPASLTKVMTLYITFEALERGIIKIDDQLPVSRNAVNVSPSKLGLKRGETISVDDAIRAIVVKSANDCAVVLAEALGYNEKNFAEAMTEVAKTLGMKNTTFKNASGLPNRQQKTTAKDMAILAAAMYSHFPQYYDYFSTETFRYNQITYRSHNHLLTNFRGADGLKTGFTAAAGYNIMTSAERNGKRVIVVSMGHNTLKERDSSVAKMMSQNLNKLAGVKEKKQLLAEIELFKKPNQETLDNQDVQIEAIQLAENELSDEGKAWGIYVGTFSNYTKAQNFAKNLIKVEKDKLADKSVEVEIEEINAAIVYKSKIVGFSQKDANNFCNQLKKIEKPCNVVSGNELQLAYHHQ